MGEKRGKFTGQGRVRAQCAVYIHSSDEVCARGFQFLRSHTTYCTYNLQSSSVLLSDAIRQVFTFRVLVFPPVNNYRRFIIHQFVQNNYHDILYTFSIGQGPNRRTIVCYKTDVIRDPKLNGALPGGTCRVSKISDSACAMGVEGHRSSPLVSPENTRQRQVKSVPSVGIYRPPPARKARCDNQVDSLQQDQTPSDSSQSSKANRQKRPDRAVYVPRHRRSNETEGSPLSREISRPQKSTRERRSKTSSPAHTTTNSRSSIDNDIVGFDSCIATYGRETEINESDVSTVLEVDRTERSLSSAVESQIRQDFTASSLPADDDVSISDSCINVANKNSIENNDEKLKNSEETDFLLSLNGVSKESEDVDSPDKPVKVQKDTENCQEFIKHNDTGPIIDNCEGGAKEFENNFDEEILTNVENKELAMIETGENTDRTETNEDNLDFIMSRESNKKDEKTKEELLNRDEVVNHKNRWIIRQNLVSDVLLISDVEPSQIRKETLNNEIPPPVSPVSVSSQPKEKKIKKVERPKSKPAPPPLPPSKVNRDECDWDSLFDDNGDCLDPTLIEELTSAVGEVTIEQPRSDYRAYSKAPIEVSNDEFAHVVEIYNFPSDFKTSDLAAVFSPFKNGGFELKWVDDTHCLGVFSSPLIAAEVLASDHSFVKTRPLSEATALSKTKARRSAEFLQPYRARPETCAALARRLVTGALGVRLATARQEREKEKIVLREAKERRRLANKQREDAWEGIVAEK